MEQIQSYLEPSKLKQFLEQAYLLALEIGPNLIKAALIFFVGMYVVRFINRIVKRFFDRKDYDETLETFLASFINISLKGVLFVLVITQLGVQSSSLVAVVGAAGLAVGLALQGSLSNFAGGVLILVFKPFKVGDYIEAQGVSGTVKEITIFTTKINTFGNQSAIIPNGDLSNHTIVNYNAEDLRRDKIEVGIGYSSNIKKAKEILLELCEKDERILNDPEPAVFVANLGDSSVDLSLRFWAKNEDFWAAHFDMLENLKGRFDEEGIEIPFPQRVVHAID
ncbi:MAG: mechanosensitive ion channel [Flavobacteriaceae bacterium]|jgi:small conductance mechanosensitive channel|nr:mechanosensitive ion channel [Flavobacteriaceae bacterium]NVJ73262.1 mechanosensitive ion channel [Flavobacteriaceae bacterium]